MPTINHDPSQRGAGNPDQPFRTLSQVIKNPPKGEWALRKIIVNDNVTLTKRVPFRSYELKKLDHAQELIHELIDKTNPSFNPIVATWIDSSIWLPDNEELVNRQQAVLQIHRLMAEIADVYDTDPEHHQEVRKALIGPQGASINASLKNIMFTLRYFFPQELPTQIKEAVVFPEHQTEIEKLTLLASLKPGDMFHALLNRGTDKEKHYRKHHTTGKSPFQIEVHGAVYTVIPEDVSGPAVEVFGPWFSPPLVHEGAFNEKETRTFRSDDIDILAVDGAENYIPKASKGKFSYLMPAKAIAGSERSIVIIKVDTYLPLPHNAARPEIKAMVGGVLADGRRLTTYDIFVTPLGNESDRRTQS